MTVRFIKAVDRYQPDAVVTFAPEIEALLIAGGLACNQQQEDNQGEADLQGQIDSLDASLTQFSATVGYMLASMADSYPDDAAAQAGGVALGGFYNTAGVLKVRLT